MDVSELTDECANIYGTFTKVWLKICISWVADFLTSIGATSMPSAIFPRNCTSSHRSGIPRGLHSGGIVAVGRGNCTPRSFSESSIALGALRSPLRAEKQKRQYLPSNCGGGLCPQVCGVSDPAENLQRGRPRDGGGGSPTIDVYILVKGRPTCGPFRGTSSP